MSYIFYCPNCKNLKEEEKIPRGTVTNIRDGYGAPIYHYECDKCHNLDAGYMLKKEDNNNWIEYVKSVISMYQNVRGFNHK